MGLVQYTGQVVSIHPSIPHQKIHDVPVSVPREHEAKAKHQNRRHSVERDNIIVFDLFYENRLLAESLCNSLKKLSSENRMMHLRF